MERHRAKLNQNPSVEMARWLCCAHQVLGKWARVLPALQRWQARRLRDLLAGRVCLVTAKREVAFQGNDGMLAVGSRDGVGVLGSGCWRACHGARGQECVRRFFGWRCQWRGVVSWWNWCCERAAHMRCAGNRRDVLGLRTSATTAGNRAKTCRWISGLARVLRRPRCQLEGVPMHGREARRTSQLVGWA